MPYWAIALAILVPLWTAAGLLGWWLGTRGH